MINLLSNKKNNYRKKQKNIVKPAGLKDSNCWLFLLKNCSSAIKPKFLFVVFPGLSPDSDKRQLFESLDKHLRQDHTLALLNVNKLPGKIARFN